MMIDPLVGAREELRTWCRHMELSEVGGPLPHEEPQLVMAFAAVAQAEASGRIASASERIAAALERIAAVLDGATDDQLPNPIRTLVLSMP